MLDILCRIILHLWMIVETGGKWIGFLILMLFD